MQTDATACHSLIGPLAALLRSPWCSTLRAARQAGQAPFGNNEQGDLAYVGQGGRAADSSSDSNTGGSRRLRAADGAQGIQVADAYGRP